MARMAAVAGWLLMVADVLRAHGPLDGELARLDVALQRRPEDPVLLLHRADLLRLDGRAAAALADLAAAERLDPVPERVWWIRGLLLRELDRPREALTDLNRWLERNPNHGEALMARARVHEALGHFSDGVADCDRLIRQPGRSDPEPYLLRARLQRQMGPCHWAEALAGLEHGLARLGPLVLLHLEAMELERQMNRVDDALARMDFLLARSERPETWHVRRAELLESAGRRTEARNAWECALAACQQLPATRRKTPFVQTLERRIRQALGPMAPHCDAPNPDPALKTRPASVDSTPRTLPPHVTLAP